MIKAFLLLLFSASFSCLELFSQVPELSNQGKIIFELTYPDISPQLQAIANLPSEAVYYFHNTRNRLEMRLQLMGTVLIADSSRHEAFMLMDLFGRKNVLQLNGNSSNLQPLFQEMPEVKITDESKLLAGFQCTKAVLNRKKSEDDQSAEVWFTNKLSAQNSFAPSIQGVDGFVLEFQMVQNGLTIHMRAKNFESIPVDESYFVVPDGYEAITMEDYYKSGTTR